MDSIHPLADESTLKSDLLQMQPIEPKQLSSELLSAIDASLNRADTEEEARAAFARVADSPQQIEDMVRSRRFWREFGGGR
jgi:hypothetical protein